MDETLFASISLHCGEEEHERLVSAIERMDEMSIDSLVALATRYDSGIGDICRRQRAELRAVCALAVAGDEDSAREMANVAFRRLSRSVDAVHLAHSAHSVHASAQ
jgi:hypothetical protein